MYPSNTKQVIIECTVLFSKSEKECEEEARVGGGSFEIILPDHCPYSLDAFNMKIVF